MPNRQQKRLNILIAPDKFKGTLTAAAAAKAIATGWKSIRPHDSICLLPINDGGDGFGQAMSRLLGAKIQTIKTVDAAHRPCLAKWWWEAKTKTAVIESANVIGLAELPYRKYHPFQLDTYGLGVVLQAAAAKGTKRCYIGIGGSATNDGGFGLALALGWKFFDRSSSPITEWTRLADLTNILPPKKIKLFRELIVAVDVQNVLLGRNGCTRIYGPQKGLAPSDFEPAERALKKLAAHVKKHSGESFADFPGSGAAGGLGFGLLAFVGAKQQPGFALFARKAKLSTQLKNIDLVITGEGSIDRSTMMGKGVGQLAKLCFEKNIPCVGLGGVIGLAGSKAKNYFESLYGMAELASETETKKRPMFWLKKLSRKVAEDFVSSSAKSRQSLR